MTEIGIIFEKGRKMDFEWKITDFFSYTEGNAKYWSPEFHILNSAWKISIYPNGRACDNSSACVSLYLHNISTNVPEYVQFTFGIKSAKAFLEYKKTDVWNPALKSKRWSEFVKKSTLEEERESLVPAGNLTIFFILFVKGDGQDFNEDARLKKLAENLTELCNSKKNSDASLKINDETILVHKAILVARSPVFAAMFENDMTEKKTGEVHITDCDPKVFNAFLLFLYSGRVELKECDVFELYKITDKYDVPDLKLMCVDFMIRNISVENVCETFAFSHKFEEQRLKSFAQLFFCENFQKIVVSDTWKSLMEGHWNLASDLLIGIAPKIKTV